MQIICNLYHYAEEERPPKPLEDLNFEILQDMYIEQIKRAKRQSDTNRANVSARYQAKAPKLPELEITDPDELRRALKSNPLYADDDIEDIVRMRMLCLKHSQSASRPPSPPDPQ